MSDQVIDFDPPAQAEQQDAVAQVEIDSAIRKIASLNSRAVMPDGSSLDRAQILAALGLNPNTAPTAWLNIIGCGSNASALLPGDLQRVAIARVSNATTVLQRVQGLSAGAAAPSTFISGGSAIR